MSSRIMIAGAGSGTGKTSIVCGILGALKNKGLHVTAFKAGPDYIDPLFHKSVLGVPSYNLDLFLSGKEGILRMLERYTKHTDVAVIEGVMGFYDGMLGTKSQASSYDISQKTNTPVILVVDTKGKALSVIAEIKGYLDFLPNRISAIILNNVRHEREEMYCSMIQEYLSLPVIGCIPPIESVHFSSRNLGLVLDDIEVHEEKIEHLIKEVEQSLNLDLLLQIAATAAPITAKPLKHFKQYSVNIAVAQDLAFFFYYNENLDLLKEMGATLVPFSPIKDAALPKNTQGILIGGGYPESYGRILGANLSMKKEIYNASIHGMPILAEGGGYVYLLENLIDKDGENHSMVGIWPGTVRILEKLSRFGYQMLAAKRDNLICKHGEQIPAHEFHYFSVDASGEDFEAHKQNQCQTWQTAHATPTMYSGFPHFHFYGNEQITEQFLQCCIDYSLQNGELM